MLRLHHRPANSEWPGEPWAPVLLGKAPQLTQDKAKAGWHGCWRPSAQQWHQPTHKSSYRGPGPEELHRHYCISPPPRQSPRSRLSLMSKLSLRGVAQLGSKDIPVQQQTVQPHGEASVLGPEQQHWFLWARVCGCFPPCGKGDRYLYPTCRQAL